MQPDIICLCETFLCETIPDTVLSMENYSSYIYDRKSHGGGLLMYIRSSIVMTTVYRNGHDTVQAMLLDIVLPACSEPTSLSLCLMYRPPSSTAEQFQYVLDNVEQLYGGRIGRIFVGDFNLPDIRWNNLGHPSHPRFENSKIFLDFISDNVLKQVVTSPSRNGNYLDLLCTDMKHKLKQCSTEPGLSDYDAIRASFELRVSATCKLKECVYLDFKNANFTELNSSLMRVKWLVVSCPTFSALMYPLDLVRRPGIHQTVTRGLRKLY